MRIAFEIHLVGTEIFGDKIISTFFNERNNTYILKIKCGKCGNIIKKELKQGILKFICYNCHRRWYIIGKIKNSDGELEGYKIITGRQYDIIRRQFNKYKSENNDHNEHLNFYNFIQLIYDNI